MNIMMLLEMLLQYFPVVTFETALLYMASIQGLILHLPILADDFMLSQISFLLKTQLAFIAIKNLLEFFIVIQFEVSSQTVSLRILDSTMATHEFLDHKEDVTVNLKFSYRSQYYIPSH